MPSMPFEKCVLSHNLSLIQVNLVGIDIATGKETLIGRPLLDEIQAQGLASIDLKRGIYYMLGTP